MPNINAAFGCLVRKTEEVFTKRRQNFLVYRNLINKIPGLSLLEPMGYSKSNHWMNVIIIDRKINKTPLYFHKNFK